MKPATLVRPIWSYIAIGLLFCLLLCATSVRSQQVSTTNPLGLNEADLDKVSCDVFLRRPIVANNRSMIVAAAEGGDPLSALIAGMFASARCGVGNNEVVAADWFRTSAEAGNRAAAFYYGDALYKGLGVTRDYRAAAYWFEKGARAGDINAMFMYGAVLEAGRGTSINLGSAKQWYRRAAEAGHVIAMNNYAIRLERDMSYPDWNAAELWYGRAADLGLPVAAENLQRLRARRASPPPAQTYATCPDGYVRCSGDHCRSRCIPRW